MQSVLSLFSAIIITCPEAQCPNMSGLSSAVFNLTALSLNFNLTAASQQMKVNFSQHKSNACKQAFISLFIWPYTIIKLTCVSFLLLCVNTAWTRTTHAQYIYAPIWTPAVILLSLALSIISVLTKEKFPLFKMHGPI